MLEILEEFHRVCVKNGLTYWLEGGTLLGTGRPKGFQIFFHQERCLWMKKRMCGIKF